MWLEAPFALPDYSFGSFPWFRAQFLFLCCCSSSHHSTHLHSCPWQREMFWFFLCWSLSLSSSQRDCKKLSVDRPIKLRDIWNTVQEAQENNIKWKVEGEAAYCCFCSKPRLPERIQCEYNIEVTYTNHKHLMFESQNMRNLGKTSNTVKNSRE